VSFPSSPCSDLQRLARICRDPSEASSDSEAQPEECKLRSLSPWIHLPDWFRLPLTVAMLVPCLRTLTQPSLFLKRLHSNWMAHPAFVRGSPRLFTFPAIRYRKLVIHDNHEVESKDEISYSIKYILLVPQSITSNQHNHTVTNPTFSWCM